MNLRVIKNDVDFLVNDFVSDCLLFCDFNDGKKDEEVSALITEALVKADSVVARINHPKDENGKKFAKKEMKAYYKAINKDLYGSFDDLFQRLSDLAKK